MNPATGRPALILASGEDVPARPPCLEEDGVSPLVICADGGARLARQWGLVPAVILGDQDSLDAETKAYWQEQKIPFLRVPSVKDETDMDLAVEYALEKGANSITLLGGWGSRIDHSLGNVELLYRLAQKGVENMLLTKQHRLSAFCQEFRAEVSLGGFVSLVPLTSQVTGVRSNGLLYPLQGETLQKGSTLTISNVAVARDIVVEIKAGVLLVILEQ